MRSVCPTYTHADGFRAGNPPVYIYIHIRRQRVLIIRRRRRRGGREGDKKRPRGSRTSHLTDDVSHPSVYWPPRGSRELPPPERPRRRHSHCVIYNIKTNIPGAPPPGAAKGRKDARRVCYFFQLIRFDHPSPILCFFFILYSGDILLRAVFVEMYTRPVVKRN